MTWEPGSELRSYSENLSWSILPEQAFRGYPGSTVHPGRFQKRRIAPLGFRYCYNWSDLNLPKLYLK